MLKLASLLVLIVGALGAHDDDMRAALQASLGGYGGFAGDYADDGDFDAQMAQAMQASMPQVPVQQVEDVPEPPAMGGDDDFQAYDDDFESQMAQVMRASLEPTGGGDSRVFTLKAYAPNDPESRLLLAQRQMLEAGDKIYLPQSMLKALTLNGEPMMFEVTNPWVNRTTHCSVLEFEAPDECCYMPQWMMDNLVANPGTLLQLKRVTLPQASRIQVRAHEMAFSDMVVDFDGAKGVLEQALNQRFSCLTVGDEIAITTEGRTFKFDVTELRSGDDPVRSVRIMTADFQEFSCEFDFLEPRDADEVAAQIAASDALLRANAAKYAAQNSSSDNTGGWGQTETKEDTPSYFANFKSGHRLTGPPAANGASGAVSPVSKPTASRRTRGGSLGRKPRGTTKRVIEIKDGMEFIYNVDLVTGEKTLVRKMRHFGF